MITNNHYWTDPLSFNGRSRLRLQREVMATFVPKDTPTVTVWVDYNESQGKYVAKDHSVQVPIRSWFDATYGASGTPTRTTREVRTAGRQPVGVRETYVAEHSALRENEVRTGRRR